MRKQYWCPDCGGTAYCDVLTSKPVQYSVRCEDPECGWNHIFIEEPTHLMSKQAATKPRLTPDELNKQIAKLCADNGYQIVIAAIGKVSNQPSPIMDFLPQTHYAGIVFAEVTTDDTADHNRG